MVIDSFDFDTWAALAKSSPVEFEVRRNYYIERTISENNDTLRLRQLQWQIDNERKRARTAIKSYLKLSSMMWDSFIAFRDAMENPLSRPIQQAKIIQFRRKD